MARVLGMPVLLVQARVLGFGAYCTVASLQGDYKGYFTTPSASEHKWQPEPQRPKSYTLKLGLGGTLGDIDPLHEVPFKRARGRIKKGPL